MSSLKNLSSRVLNMKFMRKAVAEDSKNNQTKGSSTEVKPEQTPSNSKTAPGGKGDHSHWSISSNAERFKSKKQQLANNDDSIKSQSYRSVGYSQMKEFFEDSEESDDEQTTVTGRRVFGASKDSANTENDDDAEGLITETRLEKDTNKRNKREIIDDVDGFLDNIMASNDGDDDAATDKSEPNTQREGSLIPSVESFLNGTDKGSNNLKREFDSVSNSGDSQKKKKKSKKSNKSKKN
ncbi:hypothetical protein DASC09_004840 [Saccharomycopsis crataegensis]|uniref:Uncharacterized protein n=1 Tax=Saccharomycopsis crataegensis TaxID=43959 RepID=A0AAV5QEL2_9ASCO|nr:hypothetical protein DASC09_004840 [Saccharomycopsis crataegensis]